MLLAKLFVLRRVKAISKCLVSSGTKRLIAGIVCWRRMRVYGNLKTDQFWLE
ncbi:MAG: hypothetical protein ACKERG_01165 [Candidatus Hodgkinia cicadicola]